MKSGEVPRESTCMLRFQCALRSMLPRHTASCAPHCDNNVGLVDQSRSDPIWITATQRTSAVPVTTAPRDKCVAKGMEVVALCDCVRQTDHAKPSPSPKPNPSPGPKTRPSPQPRPWPRARRKRKTKTALLVIHHTVHCFRCWIPRSTDRLSRFGVFMIALT